MSTKPIRAILIDPTACTISEIVLPSEPGDCGAGTQVGLDALRSAINCDTIDMFYVDARHTCVIDGTGMLSSPPPVAFWQWGADAQPVPGKALIVAHDMMTDTWGDAQLALEHVREKVKFTTRKLRGFQVKHNPDGPVHVQVDLAPHTVEERS